MEVREVFVRLSDRMLLRVDLPKLMASTGWTLEQAINALAPLVNETGQKQ